MDTKTGNITGLEIAVTGMAGRFPGAKDIDEFRHNIKNGIESIPFYSDKELREAGVPPELLTNPDYVKTPGSRLDKKEYFDAAFFGYRPVEGELMDPQTRLFLETAWHALEDAGIDPGTYDGLIGLYAGSSWNFPWEVRAFLSGRTQGLGEFASSLLTTRDNLCTLTAYNLGLKGPAVYIKTACSTSLAAVHLACQSILNGECDMALAGGVSVHGQEKSGYLYQEGMINSPDGHRRSFDANAKGTIGGEGVGIVVLQRLEDAAAAGNHIHAVIKGTAINNDGSGKIGYTAPGITGQAEVIREALHVAEVDPETVTYIETHGTATPVGDPIEIEALKTAFKTNKKGFCRIGSVKSNVGHLDAAAGICGLIKTILALKHRLIPPSLHFCSPNPKIDFENSPFRVNTSLCEWKTEGFPLRAGVSSFGIGGTNAHVILEEAPGTDVSGDEPPAPGKHHLLILSAKTETALEKMTENLCEYFKKNTGINLGDAAYTLQVGRKAFKHRKMLVCSTVAEAAAALSPADPDGPDSRKVRTAVAGDEKKQVVFMFSGLGAQYVNMGLELYRTEPVFREAADRCFEILKPLMDEDIKEILYPDDPESKPGSSPPQNLPVSSNDVSPATPAAAIHRFDIAQAVVFVFEYALAQSVMKWGIGPCAVIGYSFGEYTAACISGVLSLEDALGLVALRGKLIRAIPGGAMLSVPLPGNELMPLLDAFNDDSASGLPLCLAIDNGPSCIVSGPAGQVEAFEKEMKEKRYLCVRLDTPHAVHSGMMAPIAAKLAQGFGRISLQEPRIPYISNVTGEPVTAEQAADPDYWARHLTGTVRFAGGIKKIIGDLEPAAIFLEIGPGYDLCTLVRHHFDAGSSPLILNLVPGAPGGARAGAAPGPGETRYLLTRLGRLWLSGLEIDRARFYEGKGGRRIPLPLYPFESQPYRFEGGIQEMAAGMMTPGAFQAGKKPDIADWFYIPSWKRSVLPAYKKEQKEEEKSVWLVFTDETGLAGQLVRRLEQEDREVIRVRSGAAFTKISDGEYTVAPGHGPDYDSLFDELDRQNRVPRRIVHTWSVTAQEKSSEEILDLGFYSLFYLARALGKHSFKDHTPIAMAAVSNHLHRVTAAEKLCPTKATLLGAVKVIPREYFNITCRSIDIVLPGPAEAGKWDRLAEQILSEFSMASPGTGPGIVVAFRDDYRWEQVFEPLRLEGQEKEPAGAAEKIPRLKEKGVYLVTGGRGGIGLEMARHLAGTVGARLVLTGRSAFPAREEWNRWLSDHPEEDRTGRKIKKLLELEEAGGEVLVCSADAAEPEQMRAVVRQTLERFGRIDGVIHAAGLPDGGVIALRTRETIEPVLAPKVNGTLVLDQVLEENDINLDFFVLFSSISSVTGIFGQVAYCAANAFLDAFAYYKTHEKNVFTVSIGWDLWQEVGMGVETIRQLEANANITDADRLLQNGMLSSEGLSVFERVLNGPHAQVIVSTLGLAARFASVDYLDTSEGQGPREITELEPVKGKLYPRPELTTEYIAPETEFEETFAGILQQFFGFEQVGIDDNLFEYGITSLDMIHINNALRKKIDKEIPIVVMFEYPTIHSLGQYLEEEEARLSGEAGGTTRQIEDLDKVEDLLHASIDMFRGQE